MVVNFIPVHEKSKLYIWNIQDKLKAYFWAKQINIKSGYYIIWVIQILKSSLQRNIWKSGALYFDRIRWLCFVLFYIVLWRFCNIIFVSMYVTETILKTIKVAQYTGSFNKRTSPKGFSCAVCLYYIESIFRSRSKPWKCQLYFFLYEYLYIKINVCLPVCLSVLNGFKNHTSNHHEILGNH